MTEIKKPKNPFKRFFLKIAEGHAIYLGIFQPK